MTQYPGIVKRAEVVAWQKGKAYAKPNGLLCKTIFTISSLLMLYTFFINLFYILGMNVMYKDTSDYNEVLPVLISVAVANALLIIAFILGKLKRRILSSAVSIITSAFLTVFFGSISKADTPDDSILGFKALFYWRHFAPLFLIFVFAIWMIIIIIRAKRKQNKFYKDCEENLYSLYKENYPESTEEEWIEFAKNYDGESPQKLFPKKPKGEKSTILLEEDE